ncbi:MAG: A/G-specific adenine glycosylase [Treponema sp.]|nr:A/G-specific adenine glycosylase [Treponema sp.]
MLTSSRITGFRKIIYSAYEAYGRRFPWRDNTEAWGILVSEFMLQQTQTARVVSYWKTWMEKWPSPAHLNEASLQEVLFEWSGLGYNRRARYLKESAGIIVRDFGGKVPAAPGDLARLAGVGPYTAGAIACFAYNYPSVFIETNIRAVMLHFFFNGQKGITDREIMPVIDAALDRENPRKWYWALMDYGAALKKTMPNPNRHSAHYGKQGGFKGSFRQVRGGIVRLLASRGPLAAEELRARLDVPAGEEDFYRALETLGRESMVAEKDGVYGIKG